MKILFADDDDGLRKVIEFKLKQKGYNVTSVADGLLALNQLKKERFDLIFFESNTEYLYLSSNRTSSA